MVFIPHFFALYLVYNAELQRLGALRKGRQVRACPFSQGHIYFVSKNLKYRVTATPGGIPLKIWPLEKGHARTQERPISFAKPYGEKSVIQPSLFNPSRKVTGVLKMTNRP
jgi:hypothetical protein